MEIVGQSERWRELAKKYLTMFPAAEAEVYPQLKSIYE